MNNFKKLIDIMKSWRKPPENWSPGGILGQIISDDFEMLGDKLQLIAHKNDIKLTVDGEEVPLDCCRKIEISIGVEKITTIKLEFLTPHMGGF